MILAAVSGLEQAGVRLADEVDKTSGGNHHAFVVVFAVRGQVLKEDGHDNHHHDRLDDRHLWFLSLLSVLVSNMVWFGLVWLGF